MSRTRISARALLALPLALAIVCTGVGCSGGGAPEPAPDDTAKKVEVEATDDKKDETTTDDTTADDKTTTDDKTEGTEEYYSITVTGEADYMQPVPSQAKPGELIIIDPGAILDAEWVVTVDGEEIMQSTSEEPGPYAFTMPAHDVTVNIGTRSIPGGA